MAKTRVILSFLTLLVVGFFGLLAIFYARGYRVDSKTFRILPKGILVVKTDPTGAQIFLDGKLSGASDSNFSLLPGTYDVAIKKDGFIPWSKRLTIEKETVTQVDINLFKTTPSFSPITTSGAFGPAASPNFSQIAFAVLPGPDVDTDKIGLWLIDNINFPLGFGRDPKRITDGDLTGASWQFSPDGRQILFTTTSGSFLLESGGFTPQAQWINIASKKKVTLASWQTEKQTKLAGQIKNLAPEIADILQRKASFISFSLDESRVLYTASASATLPDNLIKALPGASTQPQDRDIVIDRTYVYDIKEDRNFLISDWPLVRIFWLENNNLVAVEEDKLTILDYDGTNRQNVFSGQFIAPFVFPYLNASKLLILTNLGAISQHPNLYSLSIK